MINENIYLIINYNNDNLKTLKAQIAIKSVNDENHLHVI